MSRKRRLEIFGAISAAVSFGCGLKGLLMLGTINAIVWSGFGVASFLMSVGWYWLASRAKS